MESKWLRCSCERNASTLQTSSGGKGTAHTAIPTVQVMEEVLVPLTRYEKGYFDFYINTLKLVVEVHGQQHYKFNSLFHSSAQDFVNQKKKDRRKQEWCEYNNITYVELPYNEDTDKWKLRIQQRND